MFLILVNIMLLIIINNIKIGINKINNNNISNFANGINI